MVARYIRVKDMMDQNSGTDVFHRRLTSSQRYDGPEFWDRRLSSEAYHYLIRSGFWVCKFLYSKGDDGLYHISEFYSNPDKNEDFTRMFEIFRDGYFNPPLFSFKDFAERYRKAIYEFDSINRS